MRVFLQRCGHCGGKYEYQASGEGCHRNYNDGTYCPDCKRVQVEALKSCPRQFECRQRDIKELPDRFGGITLEQVLEWDKTSRKPTEGNPLGVQRIFVGLVNMETGDWQRNREVRSPKGQKFIVSTWDKDPEYSIKVYWEWDTQKSEWTNRPW